MAKAKIELKGAQSHTRSNGKIMKKGRPEIMRNAADIAYYRSTAGFVVSNLEDDEPAVAAPKSKAVEEAPKAKAKPKGFFKTKAADDEEAPI